MEEWIMDEERRRRRESQSLSERKETTSMDNTQVSYLMWQTLCAPCSEGL